MKLLPLILTAGLLVSACSSTPAVDEAGAESPSPSPTEEITSQTDLTTAINRTRETGTAQMDILILTTLGDQEAALTGNGSVEFDTGFADVTWSDESGAVVERRTKDGLFVHIDPPEGPWYQLEDDDSTPTTFSLEPLADLTTVANVVNEGTEVLDGQSTTRLVGTSPAESCLDGAGFSDEDRVLIEQTNDIICRVSIWVDVDGHIVRIDRLFGADVNDELRASSLRSTTLSGFGEPVVITTPPKVEPAPESQ
jgi:hypothetical protein